MKRYMSALSLMLVAVPAEANVIQVTLSGYLYHVTPAFSSHFSVGQKVEAWFTFESSSLGQSFSPGGVLDPSLRFYPDAPIGGGFNIEGYEVSFTPAARIFVTDNESSSHGPIDRFIFEDLNPSASDVGGRTIDNLFFNWQDDSAVAFSNLELPTSNAQFAALGAPRAAVDWTPYINAEYRVSAVFPTVMVTDLSVPEPMTWVLMITGFGLVGGAARHQRRRSCSMNVA